MMHKSLRLLAICLAATTSVSAHHSTAVNFDFDVVVTIDGTVTEFRFQNPHVQILMDVRKDDGSSEIWMVEMAAKNQLVRGGWSGDEFAPGQVLSIDGFKGYRDRTAYFSVATRADGTEVRAPALITAR
ncbi:MAG: DUF6152 family protein [Candidatus Rariloculaceae bacterium]